MNNSIKCLFLTKWSNKITDSLCSLAPGFTVYRIFTSILFHGSILHVLFNMMALVPMGSELERIMGSIRLLYIIILLAISNAILHLIITLLAAYNPISSYPALMDQCSIGFSGILFSMIVIETSLSGVQSRRSVWWFAYLLVLYYLTCCLSSSFASEI